LSPWGGRGPSVPRSPACFSAACRARPGAEGHPPKLSILPSPRQLVGRNSAHSVSPYGENSVLLHSFLLSPRKLRLSRGPQGLKFRSAPFPPTGKTPFCSIPSSSPRESCGFRGGPQVKIPAFGPLVGGGGPHGESLLPLERGGGNGAE